MTNTEFETVFDRRVQMCREVMVNKAKEYAAAHDRLANFKKAGALQHEHPAKALQGMMAKHQVSIADMTAGLNAGTTYSQAQWDEKIGDALNYLFLLDAVVAEALAAPIQVAGISQADLATLEARLRKTAPEVAHLKKHVPAGPAVYGPASFLTSTDELFRDKPTPLSAAELNKAWENRIDMCGCGGCSYCVMLNTPPDCDEVQWPQPVGESEGPL